MSIYFRLFGAIQIYKLYCIVQIHVHVLINPPAKVGIMIIRPAMAAILFIGMKYSLLMYQ